MARSRLALVTLVLITVNIVVFGWQLTFDGDTETGPAPGISQRDVKTAELGATPYVLTRFGDCGGRPCRHSLVSYDLAPWALTPIAATFMHGGFWALLLSVLFLWIFGPAVEAAMGRLWFLAFYLGAGIVAAFGQSALDPDSTVPFIGAGGAVAAVIGAYLVLHPRGRVLGLVLIPLIMSAVEIPALLVAAAWLGLQLLPGVGGAATPNGLGDQVIYLAPLAGLLFGLAVAGVLASRLRDPGPPALAY